jgi:hypothetical protein
MATIAQTMPGCPRQSTFRVPYGAYGALFALTISGENPEATVKVVKIIVDGGSV